MDSVEQNIDPVVIAHRWRFRNVDIRYPLRVTEAYDGDLEQAAADSDELVAGRVARWEREQVLTIRDWAMSRAEERDELDVPPAA
jgi:hypothetical protein